MSQQLQPLASLAKRLDFAPYIFTQIDKYTIDTTTGAFLVSFNHGIPTNINMRGLSYFINMQNNFHDQIFLKKVITQIPLCQKDEIVIVGYYVNGIDEYSEMVVIKRPVNTMPASTQNMIKEEEVVIKEEIKKPILIKEEIKEPVVINEEVDEIQEKSLWRSYIEPPSTPPVIPREQGHYLVSPGFENARFTVTRCERYAEAER